MHTMKALYLLCVTLLCPTADAFDRPLAQRVATCATCVRQPARARVLAAENGGPAAFLGGLKDAAMQLFKPKEDKRKAAITQRQKQVDESVDTLLKDTGILGAFMGPVLKNIGGALSEAVAQQGEDVGAVLAALDRALQRDSRVSRSLGGNVVAGSPVGQSYSSMSVNGVTKKMITLLVPVQGARGSGSARVQAAIDGQAGVQDLQVLFSGPGVGQIRLSSGGQYSDSADGSVIDVDVIDV